MKKQISVLSKFVGNKSISILDNVLLRNGIATVSNLENFVTFPITYGGLENGLFDFNFLKKVSSKVDSFSMNLSENSVEFVAGKSKFSTPNYIDVIDDFVELPKGKNYIGQIDFSKEIKGLKNFIGTDVFRPNMEGLCMDCENGNFVATNPHILKWVKIGGAINKDYKDTIIINKQVFDLPIDTYEIYLSDNKEYIIFNNKDNYNFYFRLIQEKYPNYNSVIPRDNNIQIRLNKKELLESLSLTETVSQNKNINLIKLSNKDNKVNLYCENIDYNTSYNYDFQDIQNTENIAIGFNAALLTTVIKEIESDIIVFDLSAPNRPALLNETSLIMPVMLNN